MRNGVKDRRLPTKVHLSPHPVGTTISAARVAEMRRDRTTNGGNGPHTMTEEQYAAVLELVRGWCGRTGGVTRYFAAPLNPDGSVDVVIVSGLRIATSRIAEYRITKHGALGTHLAHRE